MFVPLLKQFRFSLSLFLFPFCLYFAWLSAHLSFSLTHSLTHPLKHTHIYSLTHILSHLSSSSTHFDSLSLSLSLSLSSCRGPTESHVACDSPQYEPVCHTFFKNFCCSPSDGPILPLHAFRAMWFLLIPFLFLHGYFIVPPISVCLQLSQFLPPLFPHPRSHLLNSLSLEVDAGQSLTTALSCLASRYQLAMNYHCVCRVRTGVEEQPWW